ncbi:MAG: hypothetical protein FJ207_04805 [Gemmatimonadetes bacterium]|nr:hypothetical protein [Gemmatimonadota bacterium]
MSRAPTLPGIVLILAVLAAHVSLFPKIADLDGFYHLGHAAAYAEGSIFDTSFPWATQSVISDRGADLWWGFHVVLLPFTALGSVEWGVRVGAVALTLVLIGAFYATLRRLGVSGASWWTLVFFLAVPNVLFRLVMLRPHMLSLAACLLLLSVLVRGRWWQATLLATGIAWMHLSLAWAPLAVAGAYAFVRAVERALGVPRDPAGVPPIAALATVTLGVTAGWLLRPHPIETGALAGVQIIRLLAEKSTQEPLTFAVELYPLSVVELARSSWLFLAVWLGAVALAVRACVKGAFDDAPRERTLLVSALLVSLAFLLLTLFSARRAMEYWVAFGALALPFLWARMAPLAGGRAVRAGVALVIAGHLGWGAWRHGLNVDLVASRPDTMAEVARFLEANTAPGDVVFHGKWDNFGPLFAHNRSNRYLGGMDPIFQFSHDPRLYWEFFYISADINVAWTCDAFPCASGGATDTHRVLTDHFGTRWVVVEPNRNPRFALYLLNDPGYRLVLETQHEAVFEVLTESGAPPA